MNETQPPDLPADPKRGSQPPDSPDLQRLLEFLRDVRGFDFTGYKRTSLVRRIQRRMRDVHTETFADYLDLLETDAGEFTALFNTVLINVTGFFRDPAAWTYLQEEVLPALLAQAGPNEEIRVWSAACSTGEEAYSLAISLAELLGVEEFRSRVKVYGTDVDEKALAEARAGSYTAKQLESVPAELRARYFEPAGQRYVFRPDLRRRVIFGRHDLTRDAPISRLHLLACRNTLMYFNSEAQHQIIDRLLFALRDGGYLFLGKAEMLLAASERFEVRNVRHRVFRRRPSARPVLGGPWSGLDLDGAAGGIQRDAVRHLVRDLALESYPDPIMVLDADDVLLLANAAARAEFGVLTADIGRAFRELEISYQPVEIRSLIAHARTEGRTARVSAATRRHPAADVNNYDVLVRPLATGDGTYCGCAILFVNTTRAIQLQEELKHSHEDLETAYEELQSTNEELETTNEELQSSIEELETTNEEIQSTNEELETTNEELQSANEELTTMNEEMRIQTTELDETRASLEGVLTSVAAAIVVLDARNVVRIWNPGAREIWGLDGHEAVGQPFFELEFGLPTHPFLDVLGTTRATQRRSEPVELTGVNRFGQPIVCRIVCCPLDGVAGGLVLLIEKVTRTRRVD